jgi:predicted MFS family arabinose efflux permease
LGNRRFRTPACYYPFVLIALHVGYALAPTYLEQIRGLSVGTIGALFSILSVGSLAFNYIVGKLRPQVSFVVLIGAVWVGTLVIWRFDSLALTAPAFALLGAISTIWLLAQTSFGQLVSPEQRGLALGITESLAYVAIALASWLAGQLYARTPAHDLPMIVGVAATVLALIVWLILPLRTGSAASAEKRTLPTQETPEAA